MAGIFNFSTIEKKAIEVWATKNVIKDKITERVRYILAFFGKIAKNK